MTERERQEKLATLRRDNPHVLAEHLYPPGGHRPPPPPVGGPWSRLIDDAARAEEIFDIDELERFAREEYPS